MIGLVRGMALTMRHAFKKAYTFQYPQEKRILPPRVRAALRLTGMINEPGADQTPPSPEFAPCREACPAHLNIRGYLNLTAQGKYLEALEVVREGVPIPGIIGRVCFHPCEENCRRGEEDKSCSINAVKRFLYDYERKLREEGKIPPPRPVLLKDRRVAIIGSGPAGLTAAYYLAKLGHQVTVFERLPVYGGMLAVGIPAYRLPRDIIHDEVNIIKSMGVEFRMGVEVGKDVTIDELLTTEGFNAVFVGVGAHDPLKLEIPGEDTEGVMAGEAFLKAVEMGESIKVGKRVAVIGGGNTAMDCSRVSVRLGAQATVYYRRSRQEMPAHDFEIEEAEVEGVKFCYQCAPTKVVAKNGKVTAVEFVKMRLGPKDASGRRRPEPVPGSEFTRKVDLVLTAISRNPSLECLTAGSGQLDPQIKIGKWANIDIDPTTCATSREGVYAGGDVVLGASTAIKAIAQGKRAAYAIHNFLIGIKRPPAEPFEKEVPVKTRFSWGPRGEMPKLPLAAREGNFEEVELGFTDEMAIHEGERCLYCNSKRCIGCEICAKSCPDAAINMTIHQDGGARDIEEYVIDYGRCMFCGICTEQCPTQSLVHTTNYELAVRDGSRLAVGKRQLLGLAEGEYPDHPKVG